MNYSLNTKQNQRNKRIITSWIVILLVGILIGWGITTAAQSMNEESAVETMSQFKEVQPYATIDGQTFNWGISMDWTSGAELGFTPLEIDLDEDLQEFIYCLSYGYNIDYAFVMGVMQLESQFDPTAISSTNDYGLMQINKVNHGWLKEHLGIKDILDPYQNIRSGLYILRNLFEKYEEPELVLMAYNMGETGASRLWDKGIYETNYSKKVLENAQVFSKYINGGNGENE